MGGTYEEPDGVGVFDMTNAGDVEGYQSKVKIRRYQNQIFIELAVGDSEQNEFDVVKG